jgi:hypothetical protein
VWRAESSAKGRSGAGFFGLEGRGRRVVGLGARGSGFGESGEVARFRIRLRFGGS